MQGPAVYRVVMVIGILMYGVVCKTKVHLQYPAVSVCVIDSDKDYYKMNGTSTFPNETRNILGSIAFYKPTNGYVIELAKWLD